MAYLQYQNSRVLLYQNVFLKIHFGIATLASFDIEDKPFSQQTSAALLGYLQNTQKNKISHIKKITSLATENYLVLDRSTIINLELFSTIIEHDTKGTLLNVLDQTLTAMGGRLLKQWMRKPLTYKEEIIDRHDAVEELLTKRDLRLQLQESLKEITDIERILSRLSVNIGNARDLVNLKESLKTILIVKDLLIRKDVKLLEKLHEKISPNINKVIEIIETNIVDEPPIDLKIGGLIKPGINKNLDMLRKTVGSCKDWIIELEKQERQKTGIGSLKVRFNKVFGFYIEISKSNLHLLPDNYLRKQTLVNGERFITQELKVQEEIILRAEEEINDLEYTLFLDVLHQILEHIEDLQEAAQSIAAIDCLTNFAYIAEKNQYVRPTILYSGEIKITNGRHPVVEKLLDQDIQFVPNNVCLDNINQQLLLLTGPNMAGKSVFIRQVAVIILMNQIGCFVPAAKAHLSLVDRIFVRSGASDVITSGLSTFMVEMVETAHILHHATKNSLIIMDEIGRGTSTYDGISIAWAVAEYLVTKEKEKPKTLFATHYHELQALEEKFPKYISNYHMAVGDDRGEPVFLHTISPGGASHSFGVAVAKLAGIPAPIIKRAKEMLEELEKNRGEQKDAAEEQFIPQPINLADHLIHKELEQLDIARMTPLEALNILAKLKQKLQLFTKEHKQYLEPD